MEYSTFSSGTERPVKTWQVSNTVLLHAILHLCYPPLMVQTLIQATVGTSENGVMTSELLERLFSGKTGEDAKMKVSLGQSLGTRYHHRPGHGVLLHFVVKQHRGCEAGDRRRSGHGVLLCFPAKPVISTYQAVPSPLPALCWAMHRARTLTGDVKMSSDREPRRTMSIARCL